jgi:hypothetical protein
MQIGFVGEIRRCHILHILSQFLLRHFPGQLPSLVHHILLLPIAAALLSFARFASLNHVQCQCEVGVAVEWLAVAVVVAEIGSLSCA